MDGKISTSTRRERPDCPCGHRPVLEPYCKSAGILEASGLDYTLLRPAWLNDRDQNEYGTTRKGEPLKNADEVVSRKSVADLVVKLAMTLGLEIGSSLGVHKAS